ncbi:MAG: flagellar hook assembly protein FlgD [Nitrosospira sp.]|nr:flagellar hook assembly protein FlgD [Nitrosospira sp.]
MSMIQDMQPAQSSATSPFAPHGTKSTGKSGVDDQQDRFLQLLVTQMKNQDPLNPLDNAQVTSQLAQISTVNGIEKLNATIQAMANSFTAGQSLQAASMIGKDVLVPGSTLQFSGGSGRFGIDVGQAADQVEVTIRNTAGAALRVLNLGAQAAGSQILEWDGKTSDGAQVADGSYSVSVSAMRGDEKIDAQTLTRATVQGVSQDNQGVRLNVGTLGTVGLADIRQIL